MNCNICPRKCNIDRTKYCGFCGMKDTLKLAKAGKFMWEEPCISGTNGSGAIFFSGCNLKCIFCQNNKISSGGFGKEITIARLVEIFKELENLNVNNINLVSPTQFSEQIITALKTYKPHISVVWNSNGYENVETLKQLKGLVDIYLVDCKFKDEQLSREFCNAPNYFEIAKQSIQEMLFQQPKLCYNGEILKQGVIVRHLIMPNCTKDSIAILEYLKGLKQEFLLSLMGQYTPYYKAVDNEKINRKITKLEYKFVINKAIELGLTKGYIQDLDSAKEEFIPDFDLSGI